VCIKITTYKGGERGGGEREREKRRRSSRRSRSSRVVVAIADLHFFKLRVVAPRSVLICPEPVVICIHQPA
jgi:hypothetical protein